MQINSAYQSQNLWDLGAISSVESNSNSTSLISSDNQGDTVEISSEARRLFSEAIHKYDRPATSSANSETKEDQGETAGEDSAGEGGPQGSGAQGAGGSSSSSSDRVQQIKNQIQSLKSQLASLTSGMAKTGSIDEGSMSKVSALNAQIAALEAELNAMEAAG